MYKFISLQKNKFMDMKKGFLFIVIMTLLTSCLSTLEVVYKKEFLSGIDFRKYTEKGFLFTPEKYKGEYESIGLISYEILPGAKYKTIRKVLYPDYSHNGTRSHFYKTKKWDVENIIFQDVLDSLFLKCKELGADAFVNFEKEIIRKSYINVKNPITIIGYKISGFAIKRK